MRLVVIGGNASGLSAAARARRIDRQLDITVLEQGPVHLLLGLRAPLLRRGTRPLARRAERLYSRTIRAGSAHRRAYRRAGRRDRARPPGGTPGRRGGGSLRPSGDRHWRPSAACRDCRSRPAARLHAPYTGRRRPAPGLPGTYAAPARRGGGRWLHGARSRRRAARPRCRGDRLAGRRLNPESPGRSDRSKPCARTWPARGSRPPTPGAGHPHRRGQR